MSLAQNFVDLLGMCLNASQACIDSCQMVIDMCSGRDFEDCGKEIGILLSRANECIECCERAKSHAEAYLKTNKDANSSSIEEFIEKSEQCIDKCKAVVMQCKDRTAFCISSAFDCIKACKELSQSIATLTGREMK